MADALNDVLAARRRGLRLTQVELAARLGRPQSIVSRWESRDRAMTPAELLDVAAELALSVDELLAGSVPRDRRRRSSRARCTDDRQRLGRAMAALRRAKGMDPVAVAARVGVSPYRRWRLEAGVDMTLFEFARLCTALKVSPSAALGVLRQPGASADSADARDRADGDAEARDLTKRRNGKTSWCASLKTR
jgi:transcriptional regulator with XRE-family HTH domain